MLRESIGMSTYGQYVESRLETAARTIPRRGAVTAITCGRGRTLRVKKVRHIFEGEYTYEQDDEETAGVSTLMVLMGGMEVGTGTKW
ncbi:hypothetical protein J6590_017037 [Homalodisca vitripennis]|nr:hypothetical protein J6590_017037 [Homalodisca vitripennis]